MSGVCSDSTCPSSSSHCVGFTGRSDLTGVFDDDTKADGQLCGKIYLIFYCNEEMHSHR